MTEIVAASIDTLEMLHHAHIQALEAAELKKLNLAVQRAELYARGVEGKNEKERESQVLLATTQEAHDLVKADILRTSLSAAIEVARLRIQCAFLGASPVPPVGMNQYHQSKLL